jgi:hypothetical protein
LLLTIPFDLLGMSLAVLFPVTGMCLPPLARTVPADLPVNRIGGDLLAVIVAMPLPLAGGTAANPLLRMVRNRLEDLLAIRTTSLIHQAAPGSESKLFILSGNAVGADRANEKTSL